MAAPTENIHDKMRESADPRLFRLAAFVVLFVVLGTDKFLGGTWRGTTVLTGLTALASLALPTTAPRDRVRQSLSRGLVAMSRRPKTPQILGATLLLAGATALDVYLSGIALGRQFNTYMLAIFLISFTFGLRVALISWCAGIAMAYYYVIPPDDSFAIETLQDFAYLMVFALLGVGMLTVPALLRASSGLHRFDEPDVAVAEKKGAAATDEPEISRFDALCGWAATRRLPLSQ